MRKSQAARAPGNADFMGKGKKKEGQWHPLSDSFAKGVIAMVFLVIGYQTAVFVHRAAVVKIAAGRDSPDTVVVCSAAQPDRPASVSRVERRNSVHSDRAEAVRSNVPVKQAESFNFDPNTASEDDFCRLGFTPKQARSIINYRQKGGRFRRKSDFAKSFVVSDKIYRRLEPYIIIPKIDLNLADSAAFDSLPGIGGWYAAKMVRHREALRGYSNAEQLMDIRGFDSDKYEALSDLVTVSPEYVVPYPLWTLPADSLKLHPYIGTYETARAIVLYRDNNPSSDWSVEALAAAGIISGDNASRLSGCIILPP